MENEFLGVRIMFEKSKTLNTIECQKKQVVTRWMWRTSYTKIKTQNKNHFLQLL